MYVYTDHKESIFTEEGQRDFLKVRDKVNELLEEAGAFMMFKGFAGIVGGAWELMANVDRLIELGEIKEITSGVAGQYRVFVKKN